MFYLYLIISNTGTLLNLGDGGTPGENVTLCSESRKEADAHL